MPNAPVPAAAASTPDNFDTVDGAHWYVPCPGPVGVCPVATRER